MVTDSLQEQFLSKKEYPFHSSDYWEFFGYSTNANFKRYLMREEFFDEVVADYFNRPKINQRRGRGLFFSRKLFYKIHLQRLSGSEEITEIYLNYKQKTFEDKYFVFRNTGRKKEHRLDFNVWSSGTFYDTSLSTYNFAIDLGICPFELFKFGSQQFCTKYEYKGIRFKNQYKYTNKKPPIPYIHFDSVEHVERYWFLFFIAEVIKKYPLDPFQKKVVRVYLKVIRRLLDRQAEIDIKAGKLGKKKKKKKGFFTEKEVQELKSYYRKSAKLCHPDTDPDEEKKKKLNNAFVELNNAFQEGNLAKVKDIYVKLVA